MRSRASLPRSRDGRRRIGNQGHAPAGAATRRVVVVRRVRRTPFDPLPLLSRPVSMNVAGHARRLAAPVGRPLRRAAVGLRTRGWAPHSRLFVEQEAAEWVLSYEARHLARTAAALGVELGPRRWVRGVANQSIFHLSQFTLLLHDFERSGNNLGLAYFHGRPGYAGHARVRRLLRDDARASRRDRPHPGDERRDGGARARRPGSRRRRCTASRSASTSTCSARGTTPRGSTARARLDLPASAFVVGSFQKDGVGWGEGLEPKLIKGPDVLLAVVERLASKCPSSTSCSPAPARGYVRAGLERLGVPYRHLLAARTSTRSRGVYPAIDLCLVASRRRGRAAGGARVDGDPGPARHDAGRPGGRPRAPRRERLDGRASRTSTASSAGTRHVAGAVEDELAAVLDAGTAAARDNSYEALRPRWRGCSTALSSCRERDGRRAPARVGGATAARPRAGRGSCVARTRREPGRSRLLRPRPRARGRASRAAGGTAKMQRLAARFPNPPDDFTLLYLGSTWLPRDLGPLLWLAAPPRDPSRREPGRRRVPGLGGRGDRSREPAAPARCSRRRPRPLPERVLQALRRPVPR